MAKLKIEDMKIVMKRLFGKKFVCQKCKSVIKLNPARLSKARCRKCGSKALRPIKKEKKK